MHKEILVIDDNPDIRKLVSNILEDQNFVVRSAANYDQAVFEINKKLPDLAIIDIKLDKANKDGIDLLKLVNKKNKLTSAAVIYLGAIVTRTNGIATHRIHINGTIIISVLIRLKLFTKTNAKAAVPSFPITAAGTKSLSLANLARFAFIAKPRAVMKPNISPTIFPNFTES